MRLSTPGLSDLLRGGSTLVTSSTVLAAVATQQFARSELDRGSLSWHRPAIYSLDAWLAACWQEARYASGDVPSLLAPSQELLLWERVISESGTDLFDVSATARLAREAFRVLAEWQIPLHDDRWKMHEDAQQFLRWHAVFRKTCDANGWMTAAEVVQRLPSWLASGLCSTIDLAFAGFHNPSPAVSEIAAKAGRLLSMPIVESGPRHAVVIYPDLRAQLEGAARWARERFESDAGLSIGVFIPGLADLRTDIERAFQAVFYPASALRYSNLNDGADPGEQSVFHINRAQSLYEHPLVANALLLLELARPRIESTAATAIVRSPFIRGAAEERGKRALADIGLRRLREMNFSLRDIEAATRQCPQLVSTLKRVREVLREMPRLADTSGWSRFFGDLVQAAGWPGDLELTSSEQQLVNAWTDSLSALATLGLVSPQISFESALSRLRQILGASGMQRGDWYSPLQILDASDAPGLQFDASFAVGLSEETWPPALRISPLIPLQLQRAYGVPNSTPESLQAERIRLTQGLFASSNRISGSFSERLSPLASAYCRVASEEEIPRWSGKSPIESFSVAALDEVDDSEAPPVELGRGISGGTGIIKAQSQCPFRAFAEYRLGARSPEDACFGFDARDRGGFLHKTLQLVWQQLKDSETLKRSSEAELRNLIRDCVSRAVAEDNESEFHGQTTSVERERLEALVFEWLNRVEKQRLQPFTVEQIETELEYELAGLKLRLRVDRIDRLRNNRLLLIDYKSGKVTKNKLDCPRPPEPQLLIYASAKNPEVDGMLFGEVRPRESRLVGKTRDRQFSGGSIAALGNDWDDFLADAEAEMVRLAQEFMAGHAIVDPAKEACGFCTNAALCRKHELQAESEEQG